MRVLRVTIEMLEGVVALVRHGNYDRAGKELGTSGATLYKRMRKLDAVFGVRLFDDTGHGMKIRDDAQALYEIGSRIIEFALLAENRTTASILKEKQAVRVGHSTYVAPKLLRIIYRIAADSPLGLRIENRSDLTANLKQQVVEGSLEVGVGFLPIVHPDLIVQLVAEDPVVVCIPRSHHLANKVLVQPQDLDGEAIVAVARNPLPALHEEIEGFFKGFGVQLKIKHDAFAPPEALALVEQNEGICMVGLSSIGNYSVVAKPLSPRVLTRKTGVFMREDNANPDALRFVELLLERTGRRKPRPT